VQRREVSDHCAIVVKSVDKDWGPKPFRSIDAWFMEKGFGAMVKDKWNSYVIQVWVYDSPLPLSWHKWEVNCHNQLQSIGG